MSVFLVVVMAAPCYAETLMPSKGAIKQPPSEIPAASAGQTGKVIETMNTSGYTYVKVDTGSQIIWAAAPEFQVKVGDEVNIAPGMPMKDFSSKTLNRTFELIYFVNSITVIGDEQITSEIAKMHSTLSLDTKTPATSTGIDFADVKKPEGGKSIAEIYAEKDELAGKEVMVRGRVVKFNSEILGKNWIHLQDGTGTKGTNDLTITTDITAKVGDMILVSGVVVKDKDFGLGYTYNIIIENATVKVE
jgi:hypothetical protein